MKRAAITIAVVLVLMGSLATAQIRGVPASVTSYGFGGSRSATPGPPASVTSLGPNGFAGTSSIHIRTTQGAHHQRNFFNNPCAGGVTPLIPSAMGCTNPAFNTFVGAGGVQVGGTVNTGRRHQPRGFAAPVYVPYAYPYPVVVEDTTQPEAYADTAEPDPPAPTIFERRPQYMPYAAEDSSGYSRAPRPAAAAAPEEPARPQVATVLIYRDGHEEEVSNYAIMGSTLYNLGTFVAQRIPLERLDLKATVKANEDRGVDFALPASAKDQ
jgi:hypothetical protein